MTLKKLWRVKTDRGIEIWEVYEEDGMGWHAVYKPDRDLVGRSNFLTVEEAMEFAEYGLKYVDKFEEIPIDHFPRGVSMGCGVPPECPICDGKPPSFVPAVDKDEE